MFPFLLLLISVLCCGTARGQYSLTPPPDDTPDDTKKTEWDKPLPDPLPVPDQYKTTDPSVARIVSKYDVYERGLDAATPEALAALITSIHSSYHPGDSKLSTRPIYAPSVVVNKAYLQWNPQKPGYVACKDSITQTLFSTPPGCMDGDIVQMMKAGIKPDTVGTTRKLYPRAVPPSGGCLYTTVYCVDPANVAHNSTVLVDRVKAEFGKQGFFTKPVLFALNIVANKAWRKYHGVEPPSGLLDVCQRLTGEIRREDGSLMAPFYADPGCGANPNGPTCQKLLAVECL